MIIYLYFNYYSVVEYFIGNMSTSDNEDSVVAGGFDASSLIEQLKEMRYERAVAKRTGAKIEEIKICNSF